MVAMKWLRDLTAVRVVWNVALAAIAGVASYRALDSVVGAVIVGLVVLVVVTVVPSKPHPVPGDQPKPTTVRGMLALMTWWRWLGLVATFAVGVVVLGLLLGWGSAAALAVIGVLTIAALFPAQAYDNRRAATHV